MREHSFEEWSHWWRANPLYRELGPEWDIGWVLEDEDDNIVGSLGNIPLPYEFQGRRLVVAASRFWVADPAYRNASILLVNRLVTQPRMDLYLTNTFSEASQTALGAFGFDRVPVGAWDQAAFWITRHRGFLESYLRLKRTPWPRALSFPLAAGATLWDRLTQKSLEGDATRVTPCAGFDDRFDEFWLRSQPARAGLLCAVRSREMLEWHYKYALLNGRVWIGTVLDGQRLLAYAVFDRKDKRTIGLTRSRLIDFQSLDGSTTLLLPLLKWALDRCRAEGIHVLEHNGGWLEKGELLDRLAPHRRTTPNWRFVYRAPDPALAQALRDRRVWAPSLFDSDASLGW